MSNRVCMGQRNGQLGFWVSRPGVDVLTASEEQMLLSISKQAMQIVASGVITNAGNNTTHDFAIPNLGYPTMVIVTGGVVSAFTFPNATTLRVTVYNMLDHADSSSVRWALTNLRIPI